MPMVLLPVKTMSIKAATKLRDAKGTPTFATFLHSGFNGPVAGQIKFSMSAKVQHINALEQQSIGRDSMAVFHTVRN